MNTTEIDRQTFVTQSKAHPEELAELLGNEWSLPELYKFLGTLASTKILQGDTIIRQEIVRLTKRLYVEDRCVDKPYTT